ncbi:sigma-70 family RNA polymerase sigma factor [Sphingomonas montana]|uniref:sigma-70 family RNA polymerase sigma factor n=1 Tax=Sphingomonas montana TaxID=1843236 RepID=UPI00096DEF91|nr:sigma-70 family RNA polymerase sigma factor [Sphingomonas montana]
MTAAQSGHGVAYNRLLTELVGWLRQFYSRRLPPNMVDDVVQETLIALHTKRHSYEPGRPFRPWVAGIARYKWIDRLREMSRDRLEPIADHDAALKDHGPAIASRIAVNGLLTRLKPEQARVIRMVKIEGLSIEETSTATGQSASLVKVNIHRGIAKLAALVDETAH